MATNGNRISAILATSYLLTWSSVLLITGCKAYFLPVTQQEMPEFDGQTTLTVHCAFQRLLDKVRSIEARYSGSLTVYASREVLLGVGQFPESCEQTWEFYYGNKVLGGIAFLPGREKGGFAEWNVNGRTITWFDTSADAPELNKRMYDVSIVRSEMGGSISNFIGQVKAVTWAKTNDYGISIQFRGGTQWVPDRVEFWPQ